MSVEENKAVARRFNAEAWNNGDLALVDELLAPGFVNHEATSARSNDREGFKRVIARVRAAVPDVQFAIADMVGQGEKVATRVTVSGTRDGQPIGCTGIGVVRVVDARIVEQWADTEAFGVPGAAGMPS